jgi:hypothetical protein
MQRLMATLCDHNVRFGLLAAKLPQAKIYRCPLLAQ